MPAFSSHSGQTMAQWYLLKRMNKFQNFRVMQGAALCMTMTKID